MKKNRPVIVGTLLLTLSGILCRTIGFFYRIFLSHTIGEEGMGLYQLAFSAAAIFTALCCSGFQTAISQLTATANGHTEQERQIFRSGMLLSMLTSAVTGLALYEFAPLIASTLLMEERCIILLQYYAISLPFSAIHNCFNGAYLGKQKALLPALSQLFEQIIRVASILIMWQVALSQGQELTPSHAMVGLFISELAVVLFLIPCYCAEKHSANVKLKSAASGITSTSSAMEASFPQTENTSGGFVLKNLLVFAMPLIANRLVLTLLQSLETIFIPGQLRLYGLSASDALRTYGVFTGMVLPFLMFPASLTGSVATMTLPAVASAQSNENTKKLHSISRSTIAFSLWLGFFAAGLFYLYGQEIGDLIFGSAAAGSYLKTLSFLCPFLYLSMTLNSILNGLGKPNIIFFQSIFCLLLRMLSVLFLIPWMGIWGYFIGTFLSQSLICVMHYHYLQKLLNLPFYGTDYLLHPIFSTCVSGGISIGFYTLLRQYISVLPSLLPLTCALGMMCLIGCGFGLRSFRFVS